MINDFTVAQLKLLKRKQRYSGLRPDFFDEQFSIITLDEAIQYLMKLN
jgi:hypothetical protein